VPLWKQAASRVRARYSALEVDQFRRAVIHQLIESLTSDLIEATVERLQAHEIDSTAKVERHAEQLVSPSPEVSEQKAELEAFLFERVYRHPDVLSERQVASEAIREMYGRFSGDPKRLSQRFRSRVPSDGIARVVCDYLASMTDRYALGEYRQGLRG